MNDTEDEIIEGLEDALHVSRQSEQDTAFILDVLLKMQECASLDECQEAAANLYQCFGEYADGELMEGPCHDALVNWVGGR